MQEDHRVLQLQARHTEKYLSKKALLTKKKDETIQSIRELGVLPDEAFEKYKELNTKQVRQEEICW